VLPEEKNVVAQVLHGARLALSLRLPARLLILATACWLSGVGPARAQFATIDSIPHGSYFAALSVYTDGDYREALKTFQSESRIKGGVNNGPWIDSICIDTMIGECYYQLGEHKLALQFYDRALNIFSAYSDWMIRVEFSPGIQVATGQIKTAPWGRTARAVRYGQYRDTYNINQGRIDNSQVVQQGGVVQQAVKYPVHAQEIVRCTTLAMRRRSEVMGPSSPQSQLTGTLVTSLARRPGPPNHWTESWIDAQLGVAYLAAGKAPEARTALQRAVLAGGEFDHPFTGVALLELGRMAMTDGDLSAASNFFVEASYAAAAYGDVVTVEEALRYGQTVHLMTNSPGIYPALAPAAAWARANDLRPMQVAMLTLAAENACVIGQTPAAVNLLATARSAIGRRAMQVGKAGARLNFISALASYQQGNVTLGDQQLQQAMTFQKTGSLWLFHMLLADDLYTHGTFADRVAMDLYTTTLRDPTPNDWLTDPLESLSLMMMPHDAIYERWFEVAIARKDHDRVLEISELARRHRFLSTLDLGGRIHNLRWLLEQPEGVLDAKSKLERQEILGHFPRYAQLQAEARQLREKLKKAPLVAKDQAGVKEQHNQLDKLAEISAMAETLLRQIAVRREPATLVFPPFRSAKELRTILPEGQAILSFFNTPRQSYAILLTRDKYGYWKTPRSDLLSKPLVKFLQTLGNLEANREVSSADMKLAGWREQGRQLLEMLTKDSRADFKSFQELVIVPDGLLWYLPFEALTLREGAELTPLAYKLKIRYAPLVSLGVPDPLPRLQSGATGVVVGKLMQSGDEALAQAAFQAMSESTPSAVALRQPLPADAAAYVSLFDELIVLNDLPAIDQASYQISLLPGERNSNAGALAKWFALPWGGPDVVILPSFHTAAERSLKKLTGGDPGHEVFLNVCGLMANGARTVLISRWRTGGQTSMDLVREFAQELPHTTAVDAWQRAVLLVGETTLDPSSEPRLKVASRDEAPKADHPFFWAGYMLVDTGALPHELSEQRKNEEPPTAPPVVVRPPVVGAPAAAPGAGLNPAEVTDPSVDDGIAGKQKRPVKPRKNGKAKPPDVGAEEPVAEVGKP